MPTTTWLVRKTGSDSNGGTSKTVRSTVTDGVTNGTNTLTSASNPWVAGDVGHGITIAGTWRTITGFNSAGSITFSGATISSGSGKTCIVGGSLLTIGKALASGSIVAAGDSVYIGAGVYREVVTVAITGTAGNIISVIGDCDGVVTGDAGDIRWTAYTTNDLTNPSSSATCGLGNGHSYITLANLLIISGVSSAINTSTTTGQGCSNITIRNCAVIETTNNYPIVLQGLADQVANFLIDSCVIVSRLSQACVRIQMNSSTVADYDGASRICNCLFIGGSTVEAQQAGANTFKGGGLVVENCSGSFGGSIFVAASNFSALYPVIVQNSICFQANACFNASAGFLGAIVEDYNNIAATGTARTNTTIGPNTISTAASAPLFEVGQAQLFGRMVRPFFQPAVGSPLLGVGNTVIAVGVPGTAADDATVGTITWSNVNNAKYPNDSNTSNAALLAGNTSHYLVLTNFGFNIPSGATITQIRLEIIANRAANAGVIGTSGQSCKLTKDGTTFIGTDKGTSLPSPSTTNTIYSVGTANDLWGSTWTPAEINASTFGVGISFKETGGANPATPQVDYVRLLVSYTPTTLPTAQTQDLLGGPRPAGGSITNAIGAMERGNTEVRDDAVYNTAAPSARLDGPGYFDRYVYVDTTSTSVSVYARYNSLYTGVLPTMEILNGTECGVAVATIAQVGAANTWELITLNIVPTAAGFITVRFHNYSGSAGGSCYFDDWGAA